MSEAFITLKLIKNKNKFENTYISELPQNFGANNNIKIGVVGLDLYLEQASEESRRLKIILLEGHHNSVVKTEKNTLFVTYLPGGQRHVETENIFPSFLSFDNRSLTYLSFQFTDFEGGEIHLDSENSSFIRLKVIEMRGPSDIHLYFEKEINENGEIVIDLAHPIVLPEGYNWGMNLSSIGFHNPNNHDQSMGYIAYKYGEETENTKFEMKSNDPDGTLLIMKTLLSRISPDSHVLSMYVQADGRLAIKSNLENPLSIECNKDLGHRIGIDSNYNLASKIVTIKPNSTFVLNQPVNFSRPILTTMFIESGTLQPSIVNERFSPILRMLPVFSQQKYFFKKYATQQFIDIIPSSLSTLDFKFNAENGEFIPQMNDVPKKIFIHCIIKFFKT